MGKNNPREPDFELPAHFTEWSGRLGGPVGRPLARPWPPFGQARAALRAAACPEGRPEVRPAGLAPRQKVVSRKERKSRDWKLTVIVTQTQRRLTLVKMS